MKKVLLMMLLCFFSLVANAEKPNPRKYANCELVIHRSFGILGPKRYGVSGLVPCEYTHITYNRMFDYLVLFNDTELVLVDALNNKVVDYRTYAAGSRVRQIVFYKKLDEEKTNMYVKYTNSEGVQYLEIASQR